MFFKARLKLTIWYLLIISGVSITFSLFIYRSAVFSARRALLAQQERIERQAGGLAKRRVDPKQLLDVETLISIEEDLKRSLIGINIGIISGAGLLGYFLAGKTLRPIKKTVEFQERFISDAAHELKTPLTALKAEIEVALRGKKLSSKDAAKTLESNLEEVNKLQKLAETLLTESYYQKTNTSISKTELSLADVIEEVHSLYKTSLKHKSIELKTSGLKLAVRSNLDSLVELFSILVDNAIKYSPDESTITITASKRGKLAVVKISDKGSGIRKSDLPHIFERFYRADNSRTKSDVNGFGLGLSIAKNIVDLHSGKIAIESKLSQGTIVTISLPLA